MNKHYWVFTFTYVNNKWGGTKYEFLTNQGKKLAFRIAENNIRWDAAEDLKLLSRKKYKGSMGVLDKKNPSRRSYIEVA